MSENAPDDVIRQAQQQIAERQEREDRERMAQVEGRMRRETPWRWMFAGAGAVLLLTLLFSPGVPLQWKMYAVVHGVCAQEHNIFLGGVQFPLCARNSGIYMSFLLTLGYIYAIGRARAGRIKIPDRFEAENEAFYERVRAGYLGRAKNDVKRIRLIDASRSIAEVQADLLVLVDRLCQ